MVKTVLHAVSECLLLPGAVLVEMAVGGEEGTFLELSFLYPEEKSSKQITVPVLYCTDKNNCQSETTLYS